MHRTSRSLAVAGALALALALALLPAGSATAHGDHAQGDLTIGVGFAAEPAYAASRTPSSSPSPTTAHPSPTSPAET